MVCAARPGREMTRDTGSRNLAWPRDDAAAARRRHANNTMSKRFSSRDKPVCGFGRPYSHEANALARLAAVPSPCGVHHVPKLLGSWSRGNCRGAGLREIVEGRVSTRPYAMMDAGRDDARFELHFSNDGLTLSTPAARQALCALGRDDVMRQAECIDAHLALAGVRHMDMKYHGDNAALDTEGRISLSRAVTRSRAAISVSRVASRPRPRRGSSVRGSYLGERGRVAAAAATWIVRGAHHSETKPPRTNRGPHATPPRLHPGIIDFDVSTVDDVPRCRAASAHKHRFAYHMVSATIRVQVNADGAASTRPFFISTQATTFFDSFFGAHCENRCVGGHQPRTTCDPVEKCMRCMRTTRRELCDPEGLRPPVPPPCDENSSKPYPGPRSERYCPCWPSRAQAEAATRMMGVTHTGRDTRNVPRK